MSSQVSTEVSIAMVETRHVERLLAAGPPTDPPEGPLRRLQFGAEFCETLLPGEAQLGRVIDLVARHGLSLSLATPLCSDAGMERVKGLLALLPAGAEVVANDWGVLALLRRDFPQLQAVAGRILCKMIKDPRLPSADWGRLYPHGIHSRSFTAMLKRFGVGRIEMDVPVFAVPEDFRSPAMAVSVHVPYSFTVKGRSCKIGSLNQPAEGKFATGHDCRRECLTYAATMVRPEKGGGDLPTVQRGTTMFFRQSAAMAGAVAEAAAAGWVSRLILAGDWT